jgi:hypothetical protein
VDSGDLPRAILVGSRDACDGFQVMEGAR